MDPSDVGFHVFRLLPRPVRQVVVLLFVGPLMAKLGPPLMQRFLEFEIQKTQSSLQPTLDRLLTPMPVPTP
ncbi:hypothetical protein [Cellulomonas sp. HZM]|uniref:hypothetical protein n=1 Tax=Cellulomonas sp. HZM TaxID=1454010 RepID=UPI00049365F9|nr:hypothetical protein [Cellulomonas sp. HZM]